ncbi:MAG: STAS domain-containing protein [Pseudomonadota bacterium]
MTELKVPATLKLAGVEDCVASWRQAMTGADALQLDISECDSLDFAAIQAVLSLLAHVEKTGTRLSIHGESPTLSAAMALVGAPLSPAS